MKASTIVSRVHPGSSGSGLAQNSKYYYPKIAPRPSTSQAGNVGYLISGNFGANTQFVDSHGNPVVFVQAAAGDDGVVNHVYSQPVHYTAHAYPSTSTTTQEIHLISRTCPECKQTFVPKAMMAHIEKCVIQSFENELMNTMSSTFPSLHLEGDYDERFVRPLLSSPMGSPELAAIEPARPEHHYDNVEQTDIFEDFPELDPNLNEYNESDPPSHPSPAEFDLKPSNKKLLKIRRRKLAQEIKNSQLNGFREQSTKWVPENDMTLDNTQTIESQSGLKLLVSVKRPKPPKPLPQSVPLSVIEQVEEPLEINQRPTTSKLAEDLIESSLNRGSSRYKVIGALANADNSSNDVKMECPTCGLRLYKHNFSAHYRIHTGDLPYECKFCDKRTTSAQKVHMRCHTGEKPYQCMKCSYACITKRNLDRHIINNHVRKNPDGSGPQPRFRKSKYYRPETDFRISESGAEDVGEYYVMYDINSFNDALDAVESNDLIKLKRILNDYLVRAQDQEGMSILRYAVVKGRQEIVNYLLETYGESLRDQIEEIPIKE